MRTQKFVYRQASSEAITKLTDSKAIATCNFEIPGGSVTTQKFIQVSYKNQCAKSKTDWITTMKTAMRDLNVISLFLNIR
jgi:hypothetical protein